jgi:hypothetical protein
MSKRTEQIIIYAAVALVLYTLWKNYQWNNAVASSQTASTGGDSYSGIVSDLGSIGDLASGLGAFD